MDQLSELNVKMEQAFSDTAFEDCDQENPFEDEEERAEESTVATEEPLAKTAETEIMQTDKPEEEASEEDKKRAEHEASEAKRKAEWEARQQAKRNAEKEQLERISAMSHEELMAETMKRVSTDTEKLTRRNMKECVAEYIQTLCMEDSEFARMVMQPKKNMVRCFQYLSRKAWEYVQDELKANGIQPERGMQPYGCDLPDDLCYHWAEEYFRTENVKEDQEEEEKFVPTPYCGGTASKSKNRKKGEKKKTGSQKPETKKAEKKKESDNEQMSFLEQLSLESMTMPEVKAG